MESHILENLLSPDNNVRKAAEAALMNERETNPANLLNTLVDGMKNDKQDIA